MRQGRTLPFGSRNGRVEKPVIAESEYESTSSGSGGENIVAIEELGHAKRSLSAAERAAMIFAASATRRLCSLAAERIAR
jgi:hypothetical protein